MNIRLFFLLAVSYFLTACCGTTVVLVPDAEGKVGQVSVVTEGGKTLLTETNQSTKAKRADEEPSKPATLSDSQVQDMFAETLAKEPAPPLRFRLYFESGSADIAPESQTELDKILAAAKSRNSCDISSIGHSDTVGDNKTNLPLSDSRANNVRSALITRGLSDKCIDIRFYGESDLAVPTPDNVSEAKNRRVEVEIR